MALRLGKIKINRLWVLMGAALVLGLLATWLSITYLHNREKAIETQLQAKARGTTNTVTVIVPTSDLPQGAVISEGVVAGREIAVDLVYASTLQIDDFDNIRGMKLLRPVQQGRPLMREDLVDTRPKQFAESITKGMRAVTIEIDELNSISQMLKPGNFIDLNLVSAEQNGTSSNGQEVLLFLQHVKVLATGTTTVANQREREMLQQENPDATLAYNSVTVEVTPEEAAYVVLAQNSGRIRATLRAADDAAIALYPPVTTSRLVGFGKKAAVAATGGSAAAFIPASERKVEYIVGGGGNGSAPPININVPGLSGIPGIGQPAPASVPGMPAAATPYINNATGSANPAGRP